MKKLCELVKSNEKNIAQKIINCSKMYDYAYNMPYKIICIAVKQVSDELINYAQNSEPVSNKELDFKNVTENTVANDQTAIYNGEVYSQIVNNHSSFGINIINFLIYFKYFKMSYIEILDEAEIENKEKYRKCVEAFFDKEELKLIKNWVNINENKKVNGLEKELEQIKDQRDRGLIIFESMPNPVIILGRDNNINNMNSAAEQLFENYINYEKENYKLQKNEEFTWLSQELNFFNSGDYSEISFDKEFGTDLNKMYFKIKLKRINVNNKFTNTLVILDDITNSKRISTELEKSERNLREITDNMTDIICKMDVNGIIKYASPSFKNILGYQYKNLINSSIFNNIHPKDIDIVMQGYNEALISKKEMRVQFRFRHVNGKYIKIEVIANLLYSNSGKITGFITDYRVVNEIKTVEETQHDNPFVIYKGENTAKLKKISSFVKESIGYFQGLEKTGILIVDNNKSDRIKMYHMLSYMGITARLASSGEQAYILIKEYNNMDKPLNLIFMASSLDGTDSFKFEAKIAEKAKNCKIVMMISNTGKNISREKCSEFNVSECLLKPIKQSVLFKCIKSVLKIEAIDEKGECTSLNESSTRNKNRGMQQPKQKNVLLVEDDLINKKLISTMLSQKGCLVISTGDSEKVIKHLKENKFDIVILNTQVPYLNELETAVEIRRLERAGIFKDHIPIIALTSFAMKNTPEKYLNSGIDEYISKPIVMDELYSMIEKLLKKKAKTMNRRQNCVPQYIDFSKIIRATNGDIELFKDIIKHFMEKYPEHLTGLRAAIDNKDAEGVFKMAKAIKISVVNFGDDYLLSIADMIEQKAAQNEFDELFAVFKQLQLEIGRLIGAFDRLRL